MKDLNNIICAAVLVCGGCLSESVHALTDNRPPVKVACVGNSITYGMKLENREREAYPAVLQTLLGNDYEVGNFGKSGATLLFDGNSPYIKHPEFQQAYEFNPDILVVHLGINDTDPRNYPNLSDRFTRDYVALLDTFKRQNPSLRVIVANLSPIVATHHRFKSGTRAWRDSIRALVPKIADYYGAELIDFGSVLRDRQNLIPDALHPTARGAQLLAQTVYQAISGNYGGLHLPEVYGHGMVLQRHKPLKISGTANAGDTVRAKIARFNFATTANGRGEWTITVPPLTEAENIDFEITANSDTITLRDVAVGELWVASGQSNMEFKMKSTVNWADYKDCAADSLLRFFNLTPIAYTENEAWTDSVKTLVDELAYFKPGQWERSTPETLGNFSAVAWHFAKALRDSLRVPVGVISNSVGGSPTEAWIDVETLEHELPDILVDWHNNDYLQSWVKQRITENVGDQSQPHRHPYEPSYLFSSAIRPLGAIPVAGAIWYQGESNAHNVELHEALFPMLIDSWRNYWNQADLPFYFVQLSSINRESWPWFRDSQRRMSHRLNYTGMAVSSDLGDPYDVHPRDKRPIGQRLARQALNKTYGMSHITPSGPEIKSARIEQPGKVRLTFTNASGLHISHGTQAGPFKIAGPEKLFTDVDSVIIDNDDIILLTGALSSPSYVSYAWEPYTEANLVNGDELPASTFMTAIELMNNNEPEQGIEKGISGAFAGLIGGKLVVAGGCNFPVNTMSPGSVKKFYEGVYVVEDTSDWTSLERVGSLPRALAYGGTAVLDDGLLIIGGSDSNGSYPDVYKISLNDDGMLCVYSMAALPAAVDNFGVAVIDGKVYVAGGNYNGTPSNKLLSLDSSNPQQGWKEEKPFPGNPRVQPSVAAGKDNKGNSCIYLWGGFAGKGENREATLNTDGLKFDTKSKKWTRLGAPTDGSGVEISLGGGAAATLPDGRIVAIGGVNKDIFLEALRNQAPDYLTHPIEWYAFNSNILIFNPATEQWHKADSDKRAARAGANLVAGTGDEIVILGGELKPRIRTTDIYTRTIEKQ